MPNLPRTRRKAAAGGVVALLERLEGCRAAGAPECHTKALPAGTENPHMRYLAHLCTPGFQVYAGDNPAVGCRHTSTERSEKQEELLAHAGPEMCFLCLLHWDSLLSVQGCQSQHDHAVEVLARPDPSSACSQTVPRPTSKTLSNSISWAATVLVDRGDDWNDSLDLAQHTLGCPEVCLGLQKICAVCEKILGSEVIQSLLRRVGSSAGCSA
jgi:hypothetical protein